MAARRALFGCSCTNAIPAVFGAGVVAHLFTTFLFFRSLPWRALLSLLTAVCWCHC